MHYLCSCVKEDVNNALDAVINDNFIIAWNILISRYDNKSSPYYDIYNRFSIYHRSRQKTPTNLRTLRDQINKAIQALSNLGYATEHWDDWLVFLIAQKLDKSSQKVWELKLGGTIDYPRYRELDQFLASRTHSCVRTRNCTRERIGEVTVDPQEENSRLMYHVYRSVFVSIMQSKLSIVSNRHHPNILNSLKTLCELFQYEAC